MSSRIKWADTDLISAITEEYSWQAVMRRLGYTARGGSALRLVQSTAENLQLDTSHFGRIPWNKGIGNGRDPQKQRDAKRRWYDDHRDVYRDRNRRRRAELIQEVRLAKEKPCADCGGAFPYYVMDFDHRDDETKLFEVSTGMLSFGRAKVLAEIAKCDVICANCHRIRSAIRGGWAEFVTEAFLVRIQGGSLPPRTAAALPSYGG